jgi:tetratricopeptide (TPR) repeat protein
MNDQRWSGLIKINKFKFKSKLIHIVLSGLIILITVLIGELYYHKDIISYLFYSHKINKISSLNDASKAEIYKKKIVIAEKSNGRIAPDYSNFANLGSIYTKEGKYQEAKALFDKALAIHQKYDPKNYETKAHIRFNLGNLYLAQGKFEESEAIFKKALSIEEKLYSELSTEYIPDLVNLSVVLRSQNKIDEAEFILNKSLNVCKKNKCSSIVQATLFDNLGVIYSMKGRHKEAESLLKKSLELAKLSGDNLKITLITFNLANIYWKSGKYSDSIDLMQKTLVQSKKTFGVNNPNTINIQNNFANKYWELGEHQKALDMIKESLELSKKTLGINNPNTISIQNNLIKKQKELE